jgi:hypothetical protein
VNDWAISRKLEWLAELRVLRRQHSATEQRIGELEEMLRLFFPEEKAA